MATAMKLEAKSLDTPDEERPFENGMGRVQLVSVGGITVGRGTFEPGWRWSQHVKPIAGTDSCEFAHTGYVISGRLAIRMDDGQELEFAAGDALAIPPGHDAWVVGNEACVMLDISMQDDGYAKRS